jgi:hypothetical protein
MNLHRYVSGLLVATIGLCCGSATWAQSPGVLYTWDGTGNIQDWKKNFGTNDAFLDNSIAGQLTLFETGATAGSTIAFSDGSNRRLESSSASGGLDLTGLDFLEFDLGHSGAGNIDVQFFVQGSTGFTYVNISGADTPVAPGVNTYQLSLAPLTFEQQVYIRTIGFNVRDHAAEGNVTWTLEEVRSGGVPLSVRDLATHDAGSSEGGLQGAFANFDLGAIVGNDGGQNQTGLSHDAVTGSLTWVDQGDHGTGAPSGAAIAYGNGTAFNGNSFNERLTDLSNYDFVTYRMSATDATGAGGSVNVQAYFQTGSGFSFQDAGIVALPIDGAFHDLTFPLAGITDLTNVQFSGPNLGAHTNDLTIHIDLVRYTTIPEPSAFALLGLACCAGCGRVRRLNVRGRN